jgi:hypothetical protein
VACASVSEHTLSRAGKLVSKLRVVAERDAVFADPKTGRRFVLLGGDDVECWDVPADGSLGLVTALLAIDAGRYSDEVIAALAHRLIANGLAYMCAWGPGSPRVHELFDEEYVGGRTPEQRGPFLMTTDHADESLAEALWFSIDLAIPEDVTDLSKSTVVIGVDNEEWRDEIHTRLGDVAELRRHVVEDTPS